MINKKLTDRKLSIFKHRYSKSGINQRRNFTKNLLAMEKLSSLVVILAVNMPPHCGQYLLQLHLPLSGRWHRLRNLFVRTSVLVTLADNVALSRSGALNVHLLRFWSCLHMLLLPQVAAVLKLLFPVRGSLHSPAWIAIHLAYLVQQPVDCLQLQLQLDTGPQLSHCGAVISK